MYASAKHSQKNGGDLYCFLNKPIFLQTSKIYYTNLEIDSSVLYNIINCITTAGIKLVIINLELSLQS